MNKPQAYIAGKYSDTSDAAILDNVADALRAGLVLARLGFAPIVPHAMGPHRITWSEAMTRCLGLVRGLDPKRGNILVLLPGWERSRGAREEQALAHSCGLIVKTFEEVIR